MQKSDKAAYLRCMSVSSWLDAAISQVATNCPPTPEALRAELHRAIDSTFNDAQDSIIRNVNKAVEQIRSGRGLSEETPLFFVRTNGNTLEELMPCGSRIRVTPFNVDHYLNASSARDMGERPYKHLPLGPLQSLGSSFLPVLDSLEVMLNQKLLTEAEWLHHRVTYAIPCNGVMHELMPNGSGMTVTFADVRNFINLSRSKISEIYATDYASTSSSSTSKNASNPPSNQPSQPSIQSSTPGSNANASQANYELFPIILEELRKANTSEGEPLSKEEFDLLDVYYCVPLAGRICPLVPNGQNIRVQFEDKDKYVRLAKEKLGLTTPSSNNDARVDLRGQAKETKSGDGLLSPKNYKFELFGSSNTNGMAAPRPDSPPNRPLASAEVDFHFRTLLRQLDTGNWSETDIDNLNLNFVAPVNGVMEPVKEDGNRIRVTVDNKDEFILLSRRLLDRITKPSIITKEPNLPKPEDEEQTATLFSPSHFEGDIFAPYTTSDDLQAGAASPTTQPTPAASQEDDLTDEEKKFWEMIELLGSGCAPLNVEEMNLRFILKFPNNRLLPLKDRGAAKRVTQINLDEFIKLVRDKRDLVHLAFQYSNTNPGDDDSNFARYPPAEAPTWNKTDIPNDVNQSFFESVAALKDMDSLTDKDFKDMNLTFSIPLPDKKHYNLVPNGRTIQVTNANKADFVSRVEYERRRLQRKIREGSGSGSITQHPKKPTAARTSSASEQAKMRSSMGGSQVLRSSITSVPITPQQADTLRTMRQYLAMLQQSDASQEEWTELDMRYCLRAGKTENDLFELRQNGRNIPVPFDERVDFLRIALEKIDDILRDQSHRDSEAAKIEPAGDLTMGLFSPTHFEQDLFAPAQEMTIRT